MSASERVRAYLELPSEQITACTAPQFSQLLNRIMTAAGLRASEVAIKAKIPRSQAYSMVSASRSILPSKREQVSAFVTACGLNPVQAGLVMDLWTKLNQQAQELETEVARSAVGADGRRGTVLSLRAVEDHPVTGTLRHGRTRPWSFSRSPRPQDSPHTQDAVSYRPKVFVDLMFLVLEDDARTRRALMLLVPLVLGFIVIVAIFMTWTILQPEHANLIGGIFAVGFLFPIATMLKRVTRIRR